MTKLFKKIIITMLTLVLALNGLNAVSGASNVQAAGSIALNTKKVTLVEGSTYTLKISGTSKKATWSSNKTSVAKVSSTGKVTALKKGTATITAKIGKKKYKCEVTVTYPTADEVITIAMNLSIDGLPLLDSGTCGTNAKWKLYGYNEDSKLVDKGCILVISGTGATNDYKYNRNNDRPWEKLLRAPKGIIIEEGITSIGTYMFDSQILVEQVQLPSTLKKIGKYAFRTCLSLGQIDIPNEVTIISEGAFAACFEMNKVIIGTGVKKIGAKAFLDIGTNDTKAKVVIKSRKISSMEDYVFAGGISCDKDINIWVPSSKYNIYSKMLTNNQTSFDNRTGYVYRLK